MIVLLILAGVSISAITGNESAMEKAKQARTENDKANELDTIKLAVVEAVAHSMDGYVTLTNLNDALEGIGLTATNGTNAGEFTVTGQQGTYTITSNGQVTPSGGGSSTPSTPTVANSIPTSNATATIFDEPTMVKDENNKEIQVPAGFGIGKDSATSIAGGIIITDGSNEYVWVEVPRTIYSAEILAYDSNNLTDAQYTAIENAMIAYVTSPTNYRGSGFSDTYNSAMLDSNGKLGNITGESDYNTLKKKMLKSVFEKGGFYVGRFEAGIAVASARTDKTNPLTETMKPLSQANVAPLNYVTCSQAQTLAKNAAPSGYTSSLMFGIQWDLMLKFMNAGTGSSATWGNYSGQSFAVNSSAQSYNTSTKVYSDVAGDNKSGSVLLTTGATLGVASPGTTRNSKANIHDVAGNVYEWTLEYTSGTYGPCCNRGGGCNNDGSSNPAVYRNGNGTSGSYYNIGFRVTLY